ncbi:hypothetical protein VSDG_08979 [Cytospora chrysosperma]|uniref:Uncharacterized protein n=1 Tax=Cytospora chrysosperma TaxID=252740 RepID=A0A423VCW2_CYTCH|nr:hypothetical protein VSDG_08979 [Valsa sordida]
MSRASFSIRKLINQRRTWPDSDSDNEDAFECSSAKTIRLQYELEQYQQQQLQKDIRHQYKPRSSWMGSSSSSPRRKGPKKIPKPIVVASHHNHRNDILVQNGSPTLNIVDFDDLCEGFIGGEKEEDSEPVPEDVQQLIWETNEAFKAVGTALAEARLASQSHPQSKELQVQVQELQRASRFLQTQAQGPDKTPLKILPPPLLRTRNTPGLTSPISPTSGRGTIPTSFRKTNKSSPLSSSPDILRSPTRGASIKKSKRKSPIRARTSRSATIGPSTPGVWPDVHATTPKSSTFSPSTTRQANSNSGHRAHHSYSRSLSKWNLKADNVTDKLFSGSRGRFGLHKIQADEVVTPGQVQQYRQSRIAKAQAEAQAEALRSNSNDSLRSNAGSTGGANSDANSSVNTPVEPFHLQDLPSRIGNSGVNLNLLSPVVEVPTPRSFTFEANKDTTPREPMFRTEPKTPTVLAKQAEQEQIPLATPPPTPPQPSPGAFASVAAPTWGEDASISARSHSYPSESLSNNKTPVRLTHKRAASSSSRVPILPTIPEVRVTAPPSPQPQAQNPDGAAAITSTAISSTHPYFEEDNEHIFLQSTSFTQTMPTFQHGRIRLAKADLVNNGMINSFESRLLSSPDEGLDWTAFQMAILGGAGDLLSDPADFLSRDAHEDLVDDLCDWWGSFGLSMGTLGTLVTEQEERRRVAAAASARAAPLMMMMNATATTTKPYTPASGHVTAISPPGSETRSFHDPSRNLSINHIVNGGASSDGGSSGGSETSSARSSGEISDVEEMVQVQSMPIPISSEHPSGFWNTRPFDASRFLTGEGCGIKRWTLEGHPKRYQGPGIDVHKANTGANSYGGKPSPGSRGGGIGGGGLKSGGRGATRESVDSLPQSPMLDLVMTTAVDGSKEYVPMGYNLGHDLGDFLKWESENVYATAFYGAD